MRHPALAAALAVTAGSTLALAPRGGAHADSAPAEQARVVPVFYVPADLSFSREALALQIRAVDDVRDWYSRRLDGPTFRADPLVVQRSRHTFAELAGADFQNWWPLPAAEYAAFGMPWNERSRIKLLILAHGAGAWAGADSENGGIDSVADAGRVPKGDLGGLAVVGDSSIGGILAGVCPRDGPSSFRKPEGGTAWWCNWNTYRGTIAHELGHTWGLPHPDAFAKGFRCDSSVATNMQCHWAWPSDSLLPYEAAHLRSLAYFRDRPGASGTMLSSLRPRRTRGRVDAAVFERGDSLLWVSGRGGGTAYPWGIRLTVGADAARDASHAAEAAAEYELPPAADWLFTEVGRPPGDTGVVRLVVRAGRRALFDGEFRAGTAPHRLLLSLHGQRRLGLGVVGAAGSSLVLGNARITP